MRPIDRAWRDLVAVDPTAEQRWVFEAAYRRALEDAADAMPPGISYGAINWLRDRADRVDAEDGWPQNP